VTQLFGRHDSKLGERFVKGCATRFVSVVVGLLLNLVCARTLFVIIQAQNHSTNSSQKYIIFIQAIMRFLFYATDRREAIQLLCFGDVNGAAGEILIPI